MKGLHAVIQHPHSLDQIVGIHLVWAKRRGSQDLRRTAQRVVLGLILQSHQGLTLEISHCGRQPLVPTVDWQQAGGKDAFIKE